ncbi:hypothetical protein [Desulfobacter curvatus]|uniref:hypothetical protein n=1 Tax=Desulfobacter curvatus TaxID=2290 RepID=UPI0003A082AD|nr:hypothetical protein [Desulfobacter curvatus]
MILFLPSLRKIKGMEIMQKQFEDKLMELLSSLFSSMKESHAQLPTLCKNESLGELQDCQKAAIAIGNTIEEKIGKNNDIVPILGEYCEKLFVISQAEAINTHDRDTLNGIIVNVEKLLNKVQYIYNVVFFPYKASMWDSLESIWKACKKDPACVCHVVPVPYYEYDSTTKEWAYCYDGADFDPDVQVVDYKKYSIKNEMPDVAYTHNPYDKFNRVTSIHPDYYSDNLKKFVKKLVYVPYYLTSGFFSEGHLELPVYKNMDFMVVQSKTIKKYFKNSEYYDKILPLGSPKIDKVINLIKDGVAIPESWRLSLKNQKSLMLNTSLGEILKSGNEYLSKIKTVFEIVKKRNDINIIWRPHPLLEATIKSMRPGLWETLLELKTIFIESAIGVIDQNPDLAKTIAISDGYIGEDSSASSVSNLFALAGKPVYILDNLVTRRFSIEEKGVLSIIDAYIKEDEMLFTARLYNGLFKMNLSTKNVEFVGRLPNQPKWNNVYSYITSVEDDLYFTPLLATKPAKYQRDTSEFAELESVASNQSMFMRKVASFKGKVFYLPIKGDAIIEYNTRNKRWRYHSKSIVELSRTFLNVGSKTWSCGVDEKEKMLWITAEYTNCVLAFKMTNGAHKIYRIGREASGYTGICVSGNNVWLSEVKTGAICKWNRKNKKFNRFELPKDVKCWLNFAQNGIIHGELVETKQYIVAVPGLTDSMIRINKKTGHLDTIAKEFWHDAISLRNGYSPKFNGTASFGKLFDKDKIIAQRMNDGLAAVIDVENDIIEPFQVRLSDEELKKITEGESGFERVADNLGFAKRESRLFPLEDFLTDIVTDNFTGVVEEQMRAVKDVAENLDGSCGQKVHEHIMKILREPQGVTKI